MIVAWLEDFHAQMENVFRNLLCVTEGMIVAIIATRQQFVQVYVCIDIKKSLNSKEV